MPGITGTPSPGGSVGFARLLGNEEGEPQMMRLCRCMQSAAGLYASHLVSGGLSLEVVGRLLGHTSPETTKRYAHLADDPLRRATEMFGAKLGKSNGR